MKKETIIIIVLTILLCCTIGYIAYDKVIATADNKTEEKNTEKEKENQNTQAKELKEEDVKEYIEKLEDLSTILANYYPTKTENFSNQDIIKYGFIFTEKYGQSFSSDKLKETVEGILGVDYKYTLENLDCPAGDGVLYTYDENAHTFVFTGEHGHGGFRNYRLAIFFENANEKDNIMTINTKVVYSTWCGDTCGPALEFYDSVDNKNLIYKTTEDDSNRTGTYAFEEAYKNTKDQLPITSFIFKKQSDGRYGLTEITISK